MRRYLRVFRTFLVSSLARELEFRANFFAKVLQNLVWMGFFVLIVLVIYRNTDSVAGWSRGGAYVLTATCFFMNAVCWALFMSLMEIPQQVRLGTLDYVVTKPIDPQFVVSMRRFNFDHIGTLVAGAGMLILGLSSSGLHPSWWQWLAFWVLVACSIVLFYAMHLLLMTFGIYFVRVDNLWVLGDTVMQVARFPLDIYGPGLQRLFTYFLPLAFIATIPTRQLTEGLNLRMVGLGALWAVAAFALTRWFWRFSLTRYSSASS